MGDFGRRLQEHVEREQAAKAEMARCTDVQLLMLAVSLLVDKGYCGERGMALVAELRRRAAEPAGGYDGIGMT